MDKMRITGGTPLCGKIIIGGSKNAALPLMCASLLTDNSVVLANVPHLADITTMANLLSQHGVDVSLEGQDLRDGHIGRVLSLNAGNISNTIAI
jgi:UDP-N-acetylglucosamine 1-carboxyvinyltransferase